MPPDFQAANRTSLQSNRAQRQNSEGAEMDFAWIWREFKKDGARLANLITELRLAMSLFSGLLYLQNSDRYSWQQLTATFSFVLLAFTDTLDGYVARRTKDGVTPFGTWLDQFSDKVLVIAALICLSLVHPWVWAVTAIIAIREVYVLHLRSRSFKEGIGDLAVKQGGKVKTISQCAMVGVLMFFLPTVEGSLQQLLVIAAVSAAILLTVASGYDYHETFYEAKRVRRQQA
jgi:CDP-diacylglycerol---glycerol-3-phosphate 3-phosphatidyltransferase